tara:strand:- start:27 stop:341 length:315 start_codon:yes stop_codon:yes gene_type:complete
MIIEMRTYDIKVGKLNEFIKIYDTEIRKLHIKILGNQIGFFYNEFGDLNQVIHLYGYKNYEDRMIRRQKLGKRIEFIKYVEKVTPLITHQRSQILVGAKFSKIK